MEISLRVIEGIELVAKDHPTKVYMAAKMYAEEGIPVLPLVKGGKALPPANMGVNYSHATNNQDTIERWFHPVKGRFSGFNLGIACGTSGGVFAVDVDNKPSDSGEHADDSSGSKQLERLYGINGNIECPIQDTPSGGVHLLLRWEPGCRTSQNRIAKSIDTRGGEADKSSGHIVAWPSIVGGIEYKWAAGGDIPATPDWVLKALEDVPPGFKMSKNPHAGSNRGNEEVGEEDVEDKLSIDELQDMLDFINPDNLSYDGWLRIGQAINSQHPNVGGLGLWDSWSKNGTRYRPDECKLRWKGFNPFGSVRLGTIVYHSKAAGWRGVRPVKSGEFSELVEKMNGHCAMISINGTLRIAVKSDVDRSANPYHKGYDLYTRRDFLDFKANDRVLYTDSKGKEKAISVAEIWCAHPARRSCALGIGLYPESEPEGVYNTWQGFAVNPLPGDCSSYLRHLEDVVCNGNQEHYEWLLDWMADAIQEPHNPKGCAVVMHGEEGTGKGTFIELFGELFGCHYMHLTDETLLVGRFNSHFSDRLLIFADEVVYGGNKKSAGKLKGMVSERNISVEAKGVTAFSQRNIIRLVVASNEDWFIPAGPQSRRWFVLDVNNKYIHDGEYWKVLHKEWRSGGKEALMMFLMNREITNALRIAPVTELLKDQRSQYLQADSVSVWWTSRLEEGVLDSPHAGMEACEGDWPSVVTRPMLFTEYEDFCLKRNYRTASRVNFRKKIMTYGVRDYNQRDKEGNRHKVYKIPTLEDAREIFSETTGQGEYDAKG